MLSKTLLESSVSFIFSFWQTEKTVSVNKQREIGGSDVGPLSSPLGIPWNPHGFRKHGKRPPLSKALTGWRQFVRVITTGPKRRNVGLSGPGSSCHVTSGHQQRWRWKPHHARLLLTTCNWDLLISSINVFEDGHRDRPIWASFKITAKCVINMGKWVKKLTFKQIK